MATEKTAPTTTPKAKRAHRASYSSDKRKGGYLIRVTGPTPNAFAGREVPVTRMNGTESTEKLLKIVWVGNDKETGEPVALYTFEARPRDEEVVDF